MMPKLAPGVSFFVLPWTRSSVVGNPQLDWLTCLAETFRLYRFYGEVCVCFRDLLPGGSLPMEALIRVVSAKYVFSCFPSCIRCPLFTTKSGEDPNSQTSLQQCIPWPDDLA